MYKNYKISLILLLSGEGARFGSDIPKQFHNLSGKKIYLHTLDTFYGLNIFDEIILVCHENWIDIVKKETAKLKKIKVISGGKTRQQSSFLGISSCNNPDFVMLHDAVRPFVSKKIIIDNLDSVIIHKAVDTCIQSTDTLVEIDKNKKIEKIPNRANLLRGQTPQTFEYDLILNAHKENLNNNLATDDCGLVFNKIKIHVVDGDENNIKITTKLDLFLAEHLIRLKQNDLMKNLNTSLENKVYAVVGASGGIGKELVNLLRKEKAVPLEISRSSEYKTNLENPEEIKKTFNEIYKKHGEISGIINAAGIFLVKPLKDTSKDEIENLVKVNLLGLIYCCKEAKILKNGHIINISSSSFYKGRKDYGVYSATKAAIVNFTQSLAEEFPDLNINCLVPQRTNTQMRRKFFPDEEIDTLLDPKNVAEEIINILKNTNLTNSIIEIKK
ncbi:MAG: bifunctional cytidylyltransferase/SDR family oxidoreductase [Parachlamydiales bacterium]|jgi:2-C-methyl-D-erythritol 4-phosphate cytidylyltransferase